jgi:hypothetical protein
VAPAALGWVFRGTTMAAGLRHEAILQLDYLIRIVILNARFRNFRVMKSQPKTGRWRPDPRFNVAHRCCLRD